jgi:hypothetical protein
MKKLFSIALLVFASTIYSFGQLEIKRVGSFILFRENGAFYFISESYISSITIERNDQERAMKGKQPASDAGQDGSNSSGNHKAKSPVKIVVYTTQKKEDWPNSQNANNRPQSMSSSQNYKTYSFVIDETETGAYLEKISQVLSNVK